MEALLRERMNAMTNPTLAPYAKEGEMELRITAKAPTEAEARDLIAPVEEELRDLLGDVIYGADVKSLEEVAFALMEAQGPHLRHGGVLHRGPGGQAHDGSTGRLRPS